MSNENFPADQARAYFDEHLPKLNYWKRYAELGGDENFKKFKEQLIREFNDLHIEGMPEVKTLNFLVGGYINMEYSLPNGQKVKFLDDNTTYLANQLECEFGGNRCFGIAGNMDFLLVCTYEKIYNNTSNLVKREVDIALEIIHHRIHAGVGEKAYLCIFFGFVLRKRKCRTLLKDLF